MDMEELIIYEKNMSCNDCLTNIIRVISSLKYMVGFDINVKEKKVTLIYEAGHYRKQTLKELINQAVTEYEVCCLV